MKTEIFEVALSGTRYCRHTDAILGSWYTRTGQTYGNIRLALKIAARMNAADNDGDPEVMYVVLDSRGQEVWGENPVVPVAVSDEELPF